MPQENNLTGKPDKSEHLSPDNEADKVFGSDVTDKAVGVQTPQGKEAFYEIAEMQQSVVNLCHSLNVPSSSFDGEAWIMKMDEHRKQESFRLSYFCITQFVFENDVEGVTSGFLTNLENVVEIAKTKYREESDYLSTFKMALKFQDHVNLAIQQKSLVKKTRKEMSQEVDSVIAPRIGEITKEMTSQLVGMVAIFTALSFIVFGAISSLEGIMNALGNATENTNSVLPSLIVAIAWAFCVMNLLFCFMYFVIRVTNLPKPVDENAKNVVQRYPIVFLTNFILLAAFLIFGALWFAECNGIGRSLFEFAVNNDGWTALIGSVIIIGALILIGRILVNEFTCNTKK